MICAFYNGLSGSKAFQNRLNVSANNIANINTTGYQAQQAAFTDLIYSNMAQTDETKVALQTGNGVKTSVVLSVLGEGTIHQTGRSEDVALMGEGYFAVRNPEGDLFFTRCGNFHFEKKDDKNYLMTTNGDFVLNNQLLPITNDGLAQNILFNGPASDSLEEGDSINLAVFAFPNPFGLVRDGYGRLSATEISGEGEMYYEACVKQGALEGSNVDLATEMSNIIQAQRGFQLSTKVIQTVDEMENIANSLRQ